MNDLIVIDPVTDACVFNVDPDPVVNRQRILALKDQMLTMTSQIVEMPVEHLLLDGIYTRKLFIAKGTRLVGKIHKKPCINIVASGDISVMTESGSQRVKAGYTLISPAGIQKVGYAHEDTIFINIFRTDETDIDKIEADIACESYDEVPQLANESRVKLCL